MAGRRPLSASRRLRCAALMSDPPPTPGRPARSPQALLDTVRTYLEAPRRAVIATVGADGAPRQAVVNYLLGDARLLVNGRVDRRWVRDLRRDRRVSLVVHDADWPLHWVGVRGLVSRVTDGRPAVEDAMRMAVRYDEDPAEFEHQSRVSFEIAPHRVFEYGAGHDAESPPRG